jgi:hypothetical protein
VPIPKENNLAAKNLLFFAHFFVHFLICLIDNGLQLHCRSWHEKCIYDDMKKLNYVRLALSSVGFGLTALTAFSFFTIGPLAPMTLSSFSLLSVYGLVEMINEDYSLMS